MSIYEKTEMPVVSFPTQQAWKNWLEVNHGLFDGIWLRFFKKASGKETVTYDEALDVALCYGWIDGQAKSLDEDSYLQKFTPRRSRSLWSKRNIEKANRLKDEGKMHESGIKAVEAAKADGRWQSAYDSPSNSEVPEDFIEELSKDPEAYAFYQSLNKTNRFAINWRLQTAVKPETRTRRMRKLLDMLSRKEKLY